MMLHAVLSNLWLSVWSEKSEEDPVEATKHLGEQDNAIYIQMVISILFRTTANVYQHHLITFTRNRNVYWRVCPAGCIE